MSPLALALILSGDLPAARAAWESGHYEVCVAQLRGGETKDDHLYAALCHFALGQPGDAARHFNRVLDLEPTAQLPPFSPPKVVAFFKELKEQRPAPRADFQAAVALYEQGNFVGASEQLRLLRQAKLVPFEVNLDGSTGLGTSLTDGTAAPKATRADGTTEVRVRLLQGALEWEQGKGEAAAATWRGALALEPGARFDFHASPGAQAELERVRHPASGPVAPNWPRVAVPAIAGAAVLVGGGILYGLARQGADELSAGDPTVRDLNALTRKNDTIRAEQTAGFLLGGAGILALGTAGVLWLTGHEAPPVTVLISARGAAVVWTGALP